MALAYAQSVGDGSNRIFTVPFPYISKTHVQVKVDGTVVSYAWLSPTSVQLDAAPTNGAIVDRRRVTPRDTLLVDFVDGSTLVESDLDLSALQVFYLSQEAFDLGESSLGVADDGSFSALGRRIKNALDPVDTQDVATKHFVETGLTSQVVIATGKANEADASKLAAAASATAASGSASAASTSKDAAAASATSAAQSATTSTNNKDQTALDKAATAADRVQTGLDRVQTGQDRAAAAASAAAAALFDPSSYYTKAQSDGKFLTSTSAAADFYTKTQIDTSLGGKLDKTGGTLSGALSATQLNSTGRVYSGTSYLETNGNISGTATIWANWGSQDAYSAISARIEARALAWANDRVANLNYRRVSRGENLGTASSTWAEAPAGAVLCGVYHSANGAQFVYMAYIYLQAYDPVRGWIGFSG